MRAALGVAVAGAAGAITRYALLGLTARWANGFPWGTFIVNVTGAFLLGLVFSTISRGLSAEPHWLHPTLLVGFLGSYTTFSALSLDTFQFIQQRAYWLAIGNSVGSLSAGVVAVFLGVGLGRLTWG